MDQKTEIENTKTEIGGKTETAGDVGAAPAVSASIDDISESLAASMPTINEHAIAEHRNTEQAKVDKWAHLKDTDGNPFDPLIHKTNKEGEPTVTKKGNLIKRPAPKDGNAPKSTIGGTAKSKNAPSIDPETAKLQAEAHALGVVAANTLITLGMTLGGDEWKPLKNQELGLDETSNLENAFANYFAATGKTDLPPSVALTIAIAGYAVPRFTMEKTQKRARTLGGKLKAWWVNRKLKKHGLKAEAVESED